MTFKKWRKIKKNGMHMDRLGGYQKAPQSQIVLSKIAAGELVVRDAGIGEMIVGPIVVK